jgi:eukaryotic translation initiation factor 2C
VKAAFDSAYRRISGANSSFKAPAGGVKLTYVVVGKRHHIRFFPEPGTADRSGNCRGGFLVDCNDLRRPDMNDFYLQSHDGLKGSE